MYLAVDIGGTKTLVACFDDKGKLKTQVKFATPNDYEAWVEHFKAALNELKCDDYTAGCVAIPGSVDRHNGVGIRLGNLPWQHFPIADDIERLANCPVTVENDAKVAAYSEANYIINEFKDVLYITIGTGIGIAHVVSGQLDLSVNDLGGSLISLPHKGKRVGWETFASGRAIVKRFGQKASDITDEAIWKILAHDFGSGILDLVAKYQPDVVILGGGVGANFDRFAKFLAADLKTYETPLLNLPALRAAKHPEEAVLYGCFELAKGRYAHAHKKVT